MSSVAPSPLSKREWSTPIVFGVLLLLGPGLLLVALKTVPRFDLLMTSAIFHVVVVTAISACALQVAILAAVAAARLRQAPLVMLALGCMLVGIFMLAHGVDTPGIAGREPNAWFYRFPLLGLVGFTVGLCAASAPENFFSSRLARRAPRTLLFATGLAAAAGSAAVLIATAHSPEGYYTGQYVSMSHTSSDIYSGLETVIHNIVAGICTLALIGVGTIHWRRWTLARDRVELGLFLAAWLSADAIFALVFGEFWRLSWWDYHIYLLAGFGAAAYVVAAGYRRSRAVEEVLGGFSLTDPLDQIYRGSPDALRALIGAVEAKDHYTHGHSGRVAEMATRIGLQMGLRGPALRKLTQGALIHDIGKIGVPDAVLNKPGALTPEERALIEQHPVVGWEIAQRTPSLGDALPVIRHHHERVDGNGYPDGLSGESIPLSARIVAVADVWDALTSQRAYREAWTKERALASMTEWAGTQFDPICLNAFLEIIARQGVGEPQGGMQS